MSSWSLLLALSGWEYDGPARAALHPPAHAGELQGLLLRARRLGQPAPDPRRAAARRTSSRWSTASSPSAQIRLVAKEPPTHAEGRTRRGCPGGEALARRGPCPGHLDRAARAQGGLSLTLDDVPSLVQAADESLTVRPRSARRRLDPGPRRRPRPRPLGSSPRPCWRPGRPIT